jgi:hypothetical protein
MLGEADQEKGWWEISTFRNRFVKEKGVWKIREMRRFPMMKTDIFQGWGKNRITEPTPSGASKPDSESTAPTLAMPAFLAAHPVTGKTIVAAGDAKLAAASALTGPIAATKSVPVTLKEARRRLARAAAYDGAMNVSAAYGYYLDDAKPAGFSGLIAEKGFKETPFTGYFVTRDRVLKARTMGPPPTTQTGISYHWLVQPALFISDDGRSVTGHIRLFQPRTAKTLDFAKDRNAASFWGGMYYNQYVLEKGVWRLWNLTLDEPFISPVSWKDGVWAKAKDPEPGKEARYHIVTNFPPDVPLKSIPEREEHFVGGTGAQWQWPTILPMWFEFTNPVSGRVPELYQKDCVPCLVRPDLRLDHNGYQQTPDAPAANKSP